MSVHNNAKKGEIAKKVLLPGDPLRAKLIAENYLVDAKLVSNVRGIPVYTGFYNNVEISVSASGMGMPSMMIYAYELFGEYDVDEIVRIGTCGGYQDYTNLKDIVFSMSCSTDSNIQTHFGVPGDWKYSPSADFELLSKAVQITKKYGINYSVGTTVCSDAFYSLKNEAPDYLKKTVWNKLNVLCSEMETYALYACASLFKKKALGLFTVVFNYHEDYQMNSTEREQSTQDMIKIALDTLTEK